MLLTLLLKGALIGFAVAAPVGPVAIVCIRRTLTEGRLSGMASGFGAATADFLYACMAALGFSAISDYLIGHVFWIRIIGGILLCVWGVRALFIFSKEVPTRPSKKKIISSFLTTLLLTLSNPITILVFIAIFSNFCLSEKTLYTTIILLTGIFIGASAWFLFLTETIHFLRSKITYYILQLTNKISGFVLIAFGIITLASAALRVCYF
ncbi:MAG TPA: LysE family transporter [Candidatus Babeliales bacterium]|nr:LysE family transporter [Candidatus Babeliales bacterium]